MIDDRLFTPDRHEVAEFPMAGRCRQYLHRQPAEASADKSRSLGRRDALAAGTTVGVRSNTRCSASQRVINPE